MGCRESQQDMGGKMGFGRTQQGAGGLSGVQGGSTRCMEARRDAGGLSRVQHAQWGVGGLSRVWGHNRVQGGSVGFWG